MRAPRFLAARFRRRHGVAEEIAGQARAPRLRGASVETLPNHPTTRASDAVIDFEVTANRPDCLSVIGLAREIATAYRDPAVSRRRTSRGRATVPSGESRSSSASRSRTTELVPALRGAVADIDAARRHAGVDDVATAGRRRPPDQPDRRHHQLRADRARPPDARLRPRRRWPAREIRVRRARAGEAITTLDDVERTLDAGHARDCRRAIAPQAVAGVMGGARRRCPRQRTTDRLRERVLPSRRPFAARARRLGLKTEASARFERGADINGPSRRCSARSR